jgi:hypothetical protein
MWTMERPAAGVPALGTSGSNTYYLNLFIFSSIIYIGQANYVPIPRSAPLPSASLVGVLIIHTYLYLVVSSIYDRQIIFLSLNP